MLRVQFLKDKIILQCFVSCSRKLYSKEMCPNRVEERNQRFSDDSRLIYKGKMWIFKDQRSLDVGNKQMGAFRARSLPIALLLSPPFLQKIALNTEYYSHKN